MAAADPTDITRSLRRYVAQMLGSPPWKVRIARERVSDDQRPVAVIDPSGALSTLFSRAGTISQGDVQKGRTYTVVCYPAVGVTAPDATLAADELAQLLDAGFSRGLMTDATPPVNVGAPWRVPIYDYRGVPITGAGRAGPGRAYMFANVNDTGFTVRPIQDAIDELRFTVVATIPLTWWAPGRVGPARPPAVALPPTFNGNPLGSG